MLRIIIVDDQKSIRETLKVVLEPELDFEVVGTAKDGLTAIELAKKLHPDLMLVDLEMPTLDGMELTRIVYRNFPSIKVIVLSTHDEDDYIQQSLQAGAMGYLLKNTPAEDLKEAIRFVSRGYTQFSPGLLHKVIPSRKTEPAKVTTAEDRDSSAVDIKQLTLIESDIVKKPRQARRKWQTYLPYWLGGNVLLWGLATLYLLLESPTYTSKWAISLPSNKNYSSVAIPDMGSVSSSSESPYHNSLFDPREDYKFLLGKKEILSLAADEAGMSGEEFGEPEVAIVDNTTMMELSIAAETPQKAYQKAIALQTVLEQKLQKLRQGKISQTDLSLQGSLGRSQKALQEARERLAEFKNQSALGSQNRESNLSSNLESLRRQRAEVKAQLEQTRARATRLADSLDISPESAKEAFALHSDSLFQQYLSEYTRVSGELVNLEARFQPSSPRVIEQKEAIAEAREALIERGAVLLGRRPSQELLRQLNLRTGDESDSYRGSLLKDIVSFQSEVEGLAASAAELERQIAQLEDKENSLVRQRSNLTKLEQEVKFAETVYSSNLAKSRLEESNLYDAYPQIQVAIQPTLPKEPSSPNPKLVYLGAFMGSLFLTTAIASLWASSRKPEPPTDINHKNGYGYKAIAPDTDLNSLVKK